MSVGRAVAMLSVALLVALLAYGVLKEPTDRTIDESLARSERVPAPTFDLPILDPGSRRAPLARLDRAIADGRVRLEELRGVPVVLNFWASWCVPCRDEAPLLERTWRRQGARGAVFLGLNMQDATDDARAFLREFDVTYPNVREPTNRIARQWGVTGLPETFFVSQTGRVTGHVIGVVAPEQLASGIRGALSDDAQPARQGGEQRAAP